VYVCVCVRARACACAREKKELLEEKSKVFRIEFYSPVLNRYLLPSNLNRCLFLMCS
jgi:hypothetical protein